VEAAAAIATLLNVLFVGCSMWYILPHEYD